ncbi:MAG: hypothetical protein HQL82_17080, partial [Magnetococcales bacterium]|nr:hypothetical protein [Magnetococcales bacterium]
MIAPRTLPALLLALLLAGPAAARADAPSDADTIAGLWDSLATQTRTQGPDHPGTLQAVLDLAGHFLATGQPRQADPLLHRALRTRIKQLGMRDPATLLVHEHLVDAALGQGDHAYAIQEGRRLLHLNKGTWGPEHPRTVRARFLVALAQLEQAAALAGQADSRALRMELLQEASAFFRIGPPPDPANLARAQRLLAGLHWAEGPGGSPDKVEALLLQALAAREKAARGEESLLVEDLIPLGCLLAARGRPREAMPYLQRAQRASRETPAQADALGRLLTRLDSSGANPQAWNDGPDRALFQEAFARTLAGQPLPDVNAGPAPMAATPAAGAAPMAPVVRAQPAPPVVQVPPAPPVVQVPPAPPVVQVPPAPPVVQV